MSFLQVNILFIKLLPKWLKLLDPEKQFFLASLFPDDQQKHMYVTYSENFQILNTSSVYMMFNNLTVSHCSTSGFPLKLVFYIT